MNNRTIGTKLTVEQINFLEEQKNSMPIGLKNRSAVLRSFVEQKMKEEKK